MSEGLEALTKLVRVVMSYRPDRKPTAAQKREKPAPQTKGAQRPNQS